MYARKGLSGTRRCESGKSPRDREATMGGNSAHGNVGDGREDTDGNGGDAPGEKAVGVIVPTHEGRDEPLLCDYRQGGGDGGLRGGVHRALQCRSDGLGEAVRMMTMRFKRRGTTLPTARNAGQLSELTFKETVTRLELAPLHIRGEFRSMRGGAAEE